MFSRPVYAATRLGARNHTLLTNLTIRNTPLFVHFPEFHPSFSSNMDKPINQTTAQQTPLTNAEKLKKAVKDYGATVMIFHITISLASLGTCYMLVSSGLDMPQLLSYINLEHWVENKPALVSNAGTFAVAYAIHKVFAPVRITITLGSVPFIVRYLRNKGILKK